MGTDSHSHWCTAYKKPPDPFPPLSHPLHGRALPQPFLAWAGTQQWPSEAPALCALPWAWQLRGQARLLPALTLALGRGDVGRLVGSAGAAAPLLTGRRGWSGSSSPLAPVSELDPDEKRGGAGQVSVRCSFHQVAGSEAEAQGQLRLAALRGEPRGSSRNAPCLRGRSRTQPVHLCVKPGDGRLQPTACRWPRQSRVTAQVCAATRCVRAVGCRTVTVPLRCGREFQLGLSEVARGAAQNKEWPIERGCTSTRLGRVVAQHRLSRGEGFVLPG